MQLARELSRHGVAVTVAMACPSSTDVVGWAYLFAGDAEMLVAPDLDDGTDLLALTLPPG
jgi:hypothetical protein